MERGEYMFEDCTSVRKVTCTHAYIFGVCIFRIFFYNFVRAMTYLRHIRCLELITSTLFDCGRSVTVLFY